MSVYFISHAPDQRVLANAVAYLLKRRDGTESILYEWDFEHNEDFIEDISDAIVDADVVICLVSEDFVTSLWCVKEFVAANDAQKLIAILTEDCDTTKLPEVDAFIDLTGMHQKQQFATLQEELDPLIDTLEPEALDYAETLDFVERIPITLGVFGGMNQRFQRDLKRFIEDNLSDHNLEVNLIPQVVPSRKKAQAILDSTFTDIVLYGRLTKEGFVKVGFVTTRGWSLTSDKVVGVTDSVEFDTEFENFWDLYCILKVAIGNLETARHRHEIAEQCYAEALDHMAPDRARSMGAQYIFAYQGNLYCERMNWEEALVVFTEAIELDPSLEKVIAERGYVYSQLGQYDLAIEDCSEAIRLNPYYHPPYHNRGVSHEKLGQYDKAISDYTEAIRLDSSYAPTYHNRGYIYIRLSMWSEALDDFQAYVRLTDDDDSDIRAWIAWLPRLFDQL